MLFRSNTYFSGHSPHGLSHECSILLVPTDHQLDWGIKQSLKQLVDLGPGNSKHMSHPMLLKQIDENLGAVHLRKQDGISSFWSKQKGVATQCAFKHTPPPRGASHLICGSINIMRKAKKLISQFNGRSLIVFCALELHIIQIKCRLLGYTLCRLNRVDFGNLLNGMKVCSSQTNYASGLHVWRSAAAFRAKESPALSWPMPSGVC